MKNLEVIIFDNLIQANSDIVGQTQAVKAVPPITGHFVQPNAKGSLYRPANLEDISTRAHKAGDKFCKMFSA